MQDSDSVTIRIEDAVYQLRRTPWIVLSGGTCRCSKCEVQTASLDLKSIFDFSVDHEKCGPKYSFCDWIFVQRLCSVFRSRGKS